ncbi:MAG: NIPSNAP family protein [Alphaproteobacteria bacterium]|nr:NIPSNAP family protein [Alphaproteobacteria bacterium]
MRNGLKGAILAIAGAGALALAGPAAAPAAAAEVASHVTFPGPAPLTTPGVFSLRTFKVKKGAFEETLRLSQQYIWPFYEKLGARNVAYWLEVPAPGQDVSDRDYDVVHMITHYESVAHWQMTRTPWAAGEDDESFVRMANAMTRRYELTLSETHVLATGYLAGSAPSELPASSDFPLTDLGTYVKVCSQVANKAFPDWKAGGADTYCQCALERMGKDPAGWSRAYHIAWMRSGAFAKPDITSQTMADNHAACAPK